MATIKDVAREAGVSVTTVSIVINGKAKERSISEATQNKIRDAMQRLGYAPNMSARRLRSRDSEKPVIALYWPLDFRTGILSSFLNSFQKEIERIHFNCGLMVQTYKADELERYDTAILKNGYNGLIVGACTQKDLEHLEAIHPQMPVILINRDSEEFSTVGTDNEEIGLMAAEAFRKRGCKELAVFSSGEKFFASQKRNQNFIHNCEEAGIKIPKEFIFEGNSTAVDGYEIGERFCKIDNRPHFIYCDADIVSYGALNAFHKNGLRIPEDVEILTVGMLEEEVSEYSVPSLSSVQMPNDEIGAAVIDLMQKAVEHKASRPEHIKVRSRLIYRESFLEKE